MAKKFTFDDAITTDIKGAASDSYIDNIIIAYFISDNFFDQISNNAGASLNFALKILMLGFVFSIVYHGMAKFLNKIFGVVNNKNNENT